MNGGLRISYKTNKFSEWNTSKFNEDDIVMYRIYLSINGGSPIITTSVSERKP